MKRRFELSSVFLLAACLLALAQRPGEAGPEQSNRPPQGNAPRANQGKGPHRRRSASPTRSRSRKSAKTERVTYPSNNERSLVWTRHAE
jgi:hypothetical protein